MDTPALGQSPKQKKPEISPLIRTEPLEKQFDKVNPLGTEAKMMQGLE